MMYINYVSYVHVYYVHTCTGTLVISVIAKYMNVFQP